MKKIILYAVVFLVGSAALPAQSILTLPSDTSVRTGIVTDEFDPFDIHLIVRNNTTLGHTFTWMMKGYSTPSSDWEVKLCDNNNCYDLLFNAGPYESLPVPAGDTMDFKFQFSPHGVSGTGEADVVVFLTGDSAGTARNLHFTGHITAQAPNGIQEKGITKILVYPNPVERSFVVSGLEDAGNLAFEVYDVIGHLVQSKIAEALGNQVTISVQDLPAGTYLLKVRNSAGQVVGSAKLNKVQ